MISARVLLRACRPRQWIKNILVLTAPVAAGIAFQPRAALEMAVAVVAFTLAASGIYLVNDVVDVEADRAHATKKRRPVASGELSVRYISNTARDTPASAIASARAMEIEFPTTRVSVPSVAVT